MFSHAVNAFANCIPLQLVTFGFISTCLSEPLYSPLVASVVQSGLLASYFATHIPFNWSSPKVNAGCTIHLSNASAVLLTYNPEPSVVISVSVE